MKIIITNKQYQTLIENVINTPTIDEGVGELVRSLLGRFSGKTSVANNPINPENTITQKLDTDIRKKDKEFPNNRTDIDFMNTLLRIKAAYEKIRLGTYLEPNESDYISLQDANRAIKSLIEYIATTYNKNLKSVYKGINNNRYKGNSRGAQLLRLADSMKYVDKTDLPNHSKEKPKNNNVPRGTKSVPRPDVSTTKPKNTKPIPNNKQNNPVDKFNKMPNSKKTNVEPEYDFSKDKQTNEPTKKSGVYVQQPKARPQSTVVQQPISNNQKTINKNSTQVQLPKGYSGNVNKNGVNVQLPSNKQVQTKSNKNVHVQLPNQPKKKGPYVQPPK